MFEHAFEDSAMNGSKTCHTKSKGIRLHKFRDVTRHTVCLFLVCIVVIVSSLFGVVFLHQFACFVDGDFAFDISACSFLQIF